MKQKSPFIIILGIGVLLMGVLLPLFYLGTRAFEAGPEGFIELLQRKRNWELLLNTISLTIGVLITCLCIALPMAWITTRTDIKAPRIWALFGVLPLAIPSYLMAYALLSMGGNIGVMAQLTEWVPPRMSGYWGAVFILSLCNFPYLFFNLRAAWLTLDPALEDVAYSLGQNRRQILLRVVLPQLKPALLSGSLLISLHVLSEFAAVSLMRYETLSLVLYTQFISGLNVSYASCIALILLSYTMILLIIEGWFLRRIRFDKAGSTSVRRLKPVQLGSWSYAAYGFLSFIFFISVIGPVTTILFWARQADYTYIWADLADSLKDSISASLPAAIFATIFVLPIVYLSIRTPSRWTRLLERSTYIAYSVPALAFALGLISLSMNAEEILYEKLHIDLRVYQTLFLLVYAYTIHYLAEAVGPIRSALYQTSPRMEEAARSLGYTRTQTFFKVTFPLIRNGMIMSSVFIFLSCMKELHLTIILSPLGYNTLALNVWSYIEEALFAQAAPFALTILLFSGMFVGLLLIQEKKYS